MSSGWWLWIAMFFLFWMMPLGYGWGYRGWGPPYPRYYQRQRGERAAAAGGPTTLDHHAWGWGGDVLWGALLVGALWAITLLWMSR